ncbi:MAG: hypothetical protein RL333_93 [Pseudomonadota bacterium]|jgi:hypothetical protein
MMSALHLKIALLILLLVNALVFMLRGELNDSFDSLAWIVLMVLYEIETGRIQRLQSGWLQLPWIRNLAVLVVVFAELSYFFEGAWLDGVYSFLWLLVVALFEFESRYPDAVSAHPQGFRAAGAGLVLGMIGVIGAWISEHAYFNAYDGLIWSLAFLIIDLDLMASALDPADQRRHHS